MLEGEMKQSHSCHGAGVLQEALWSVQQVRRILAFIHYFTHRNRRGLVDLWLLKKLNWRLLEITNPQVHKSAILDLLQIMGRISFFSGLVVWTPTSPQVRRPGEGSSAEVRRLQFLLHIFWATRRG